MVCQSLSAFFLKFESKIRGQERLCCPVKAAREKKRVSEGGQKGRTAAESVSLSEVYPPEAEGGKMKKYKTDRTGIDERAARPYNGEKSKEPP